MSDNLSSSLGFYKNKYSCEIHWNATITGANSSNTKFATASSTNCLEVYDTSPNGDMYNQSSQRIDIKRDGLYACYGFLQFASVPDAVAYVTEFAVNGVVTNWRQFTKNGGLNTVMSTNSGLLNLSSGDYIELWYIIYTSGITIGSAGNVNDSRLAVQYIGEV